MVKCHVDLTALKLTIGSTVVYDIDLIANTFKFAGVEQEDGDDRGSARRQRADNPLELRSFR